MGRQQADLATAYVSQSLVYSNKLGAGMLLALRQATLCPRLKTIISQRRCSHSDRVKLRREAKYKGLDVVRSDKSASMSSCHFSVPVFVSMPVAQKT